MPSSSLIEQAINKVGVKGVLSRLTPAEQVALLYDWRAWARPEQMPPPGDWLTWLIMTGRGWGKTRTGAETMRRWVESGEASRIAFVGRTPADVRDTMVEGESGILACTPLERRPEYEPTKRKLTWPNGTIGLTFTSYEPDQLRGPQFDRIWWDELQSFQYLRETWNNGQLALRLGNPRQIVTMTPRPVSIVKELIAAATTVITKGTTYDNRANLAPAFFKQIVARYEGTTMGQTQIYGRLVDDLPGALWRRDIIVLKEPVNLQRIVVAIDPATTSQEDSDETGIVVVGIDDHRPVYGYVLGDYSLRSTPEIWARKAVQAYYQHKANLIVAEANQGGEMITQVVHTVDDKVPVKLVHASTGKHTRAEPIAALYEQGRIFHARRFVDLEDQMCVWLPEDRESPDRMDALVWAFSELMLGQRAWIVA